MEFLNIIWSESFWFPPGKSWKDMENTPDSDTYFPRPIDLNWSLPLGLLLLLFRFAFEKVVLNPLGRYLGVRNKQVVPVKPNDVLEKYYKKNGFVNNNNNNMESVAKQTDMTVRQVEVWFRQRKVQSAPCNSQKFRECGWHFFFYALSFWYGVIVLWNKPWLWDTMQCWNGWPKNGVTNDIYLLYLTELAFYWSLVFSLLTDHKRKDFVVMIVHHVATILLLYCSWSNNFVRIGTLVLIAHDAADYWMAAAKMAKYSKHPKACEFFFVCFVVVWIISRLIYYPFWVIYSTYVESQDEVGIIPAYYFYNGLLLVLQILHILWTYMILRIALQKFSHGEMKDVRSDSESDSD